MAAGSEQTRRTSLGTTQLIPAGQVKPAISERNERAARETPTFYAWEAASPTERVIHVRGALAWRE